MHTTYSLLPNGNSNPNDSRVIVNGLGVHSFYFTSELRFYGHIW